MYIGCIAAKYGWIFGDLILMEAENGIIWGLWGIKVANIKE